MRTVFLSNLRYLTLAISIAVLVLSMGNARAVTSYDDDIAPRIFNPSCIKCHGASCSQGSKRFHTYAFAISGTSATRANTRIQQGSMPLLGGNCGTGPALALSAELKILMQKWINDGTKKSNAAPVAAADNYNVDQDMDLSPAAAEGVLDNDDDADNDDLTAILVDDVDHGELTLNANGSFTYSPENAYVGPDEFSYKANDGGKDSSVVTVSIAVNAVDAIPVAVDDDDETPEGFAGDGRRAGE